MRLIWFTLAWALGISLARALPSIAMEAWGAAALALLLVAFVSRRRRLLWPLILAAALAAGGCRQTWAPQDSDIARHNGFVVSVNGIVADEPRLRDDRIQIHLQAESIFVNHETLNTSGAVLVEAERSGEIAYGDRIRATGALRTPATWDSFSYADYLARQGVFSIMRHAGVEVIESGLGAPGHARLLELKDFVRRQIASALPEPQAGLLTGILLGDERGISPELSDAFARAGAAHVVAISGFNMVIVSAIVIRVLSHAFGGRTPVVVFGAVTIILLYSLFVGASPGILRAALMSSLLVIGSQLKRKTFVPASLAFATLVLSLGDPSVLLDIGFQLSLFAVLGLALFADSLSLRFRALLGRILPARVAEPLHGFLNEPLIVSLAAQITTFPLIILYFGRFSLVAIPVNLLIVPVQAAVLLLGLAAVVIHAFAPAIGALIYWAELLCLSWTIGVVRLFAGWEYADISVNVDGRLVQLFYLLLIGGAMVRYANPKLWQRLMAQLRGRSLRIAVIAVSLAVIALMAASALSRPDGRLHVWLLDMGHSNAVMIQTPGGAHILIDGGRFPSRLLTAIGDRLPFYDREIEVLVITHPDEWDIAALSSVLQRYTVGAALYNGQPNTGAVYREIREQLAHAGTPVVDAVAGQRLEFSDGTQIDVLHPQTKPSITDKLGDAALVLRLSYGDVSFLLTSDVSAAAQREMIESDISPVAAVMQIPQHGRARALDEDFLGLAQPQVALLQSDVANRRDDPDPDTLALFDEIPLFRTDEAGTIHLSTDGVSLLIHH